MSNHPKTGQPNASEAIHELDLGEVAGGANPLEGQHVFVMKRKDDEETKTLEAPFVPLVCLPSLMIDRIDIEFPAQEASPQR